MNKFLIHILLAFIWGAVTGTFSIGNLFIGFVLGYIILLITQPVLYKTDYTTNFWRAIGLIIYLLKEILMSSVQVAIDVLRPDLKMKSGVIAIPFENDETDMEITMLANMISLTPGTLSLDVSDDRKKLYIHAMYIEPNADAVREVIKTGFEKRIMQVTR